VDARRVGWTAGKAIVALIPLSAVAYFSWWGLDKALGRALWAQIGSLAVAYALGTVAYCLAAWALKMPELKEILGLVRRRREPRQTEEAINSEP
jgi:hypothetical protein